MENTINNNQTDFMKGLSRTWPFSQSLSDYTTPMKILILIARLITFVLYSIFFLIKAIVLFIFGLCKTNKVIK